MGRISAVEADYVVALILNPDPAHEARYPRAFFWFDVDHEAAHFPQELTTHEGELVILFLEIGIENNHLCEAQRQEVHGVEAGKPLEHAMAEARLSDE